MLQARWSWTRFTLEDLQPHQPRMEMHHSPDNISSIHTLPFNSAFRHSHIIMHPAGKSEDCDVSETIPMSMLPLGKWNWTSFTRLPHRNQTWKYFLWKTEGSRPLQYPRNSQKLLKSRETLEQIAWRSCECVIPANMAGQIGGTLSNLV